MLAALFEIPQTQADWDRWSYHHRDSHARIRQAIQKKGGPRLTEYLIDPIGEFADFLTANQQSHIEMDGVLGVQSSDLQSVDLRDPGQREAWIGAHALEHQTAEFALGI